MIKNKKLALLRFFLLIFVSHAQVSHAQVTIGSAETPLTGALLQIKEDKGAAGNSNRGLGMPQFKLTSKTNLYPMFETVPGSWTKQYNKFSFFHFFWRSISLQKLIANRHLITPSLPPPKGEELASQVKIIYSDSKLFGFGALLSSLFRRGRGEVMCAQNPSFLFRHNVIIKSIEISSSIVSYFRRLVKVRVGYGVNILWQSGNGFLYSPSNLPERVAFGRCHESENKFKNYINKQTKTHPLPLSHCVKASPWGGWKG